jgi:hypothetical protein
MPQHRVALLEKKIKSSLKKLRFYFFSAVLRGVILKHQHPSLQEQSALKTVQSGRKKASLCSFFWKIAQ